MKINTDLDEKSLFAVWLDSFNGFEYKYKSVLVDDYGGGDFSDVIARNEKFLRENAGDAIVNILFSAARESYLEYVLNGLERRGVDYVTLTDEDYPPELKEAPCPPLVIYLKGNKQLLQDEKFAIVGSRKSLPFALAKAEEFCERLNEAGFTIVTGIAEGVDTHVVRAGLKSGKIISVQAGGFDFIYPGANADLAKKVAESGLLLSEYPPGIQPRRFHFPVRNRIIAALGKGTLVVSGGERSGTNYTAEYADGMSRQVFAIPYSPGVASGAGCNALIKKGAYLTDCIDDILGYYGIDTAKTNEQTLSEGESEIYELLKTGEKHVDELSRLTGKKAYELAPVLTMLEIKKLIIKLGGNKYGRL